MGKTIFPSLHFQSIVSAMIGHKPGELRADYFRRISEPAHDDSEHKFQPSTLNPGICGVCGWIDPRITCTDCPESPHEHAQEAAKLFAGMPEAEQAQRYVVVPGSFGFFPELLRMLGGRRRED